MKLKSFFRLFSLFFLCIFLYPLLTYSNIQNTNQQTLLVLGDSLSSGYGIDPSQGWVALLQQRLTRDGYSYTVVNDSISGDTSSNGLQRLPQLLSSSKPEIVIIALGANDALRGLLLTVTKKNLSRMIFLAKGSGARVLLLGVRMLPNYGEFYRHHFERIFPSLADKYHVPLVSKMLDGVAGKAEMMQADGLHPTKQAQPLIFKNVWRQLKFILKKP